MKTTEKPHIQSPLTWYADSKRSHKCVWIPYLNHIEQTKEGWDVTHRTGMLRIDLKTAKTIMLYGGSGTVPLDFIRDIQRHQCVLVVHQRSNPIPILLHASASPDTKDVLTAQVLAASDQRKQAYIARTLLTARFKHMESRIVIPDSVYASLSSERNVDRLRMIEATSTARYWKEYFGSLNLSLTRREKHPVTDALNAGSAFLAALLLRWVLFHKLSPYHGYLHTQTGYPALVYDLMEPYRYLIEDAVFSAWHEYRSPCRDFRHAVFENIKGSLDQKVWVPATHQEAHQKSLLHGIVLALRAYLMTDTARFVVPVSGDKNGGLPVDIGLFSKYGQPRLSSMW